MNCALNSTVVVLLVLACHMICVSAQISGISCGSCGEECTDACGTRHFRTCCFNYLRKRGSSPPIPSSPDGHQKLWFLNAPASEKSRIHSASTTTAVGQEQINGNAPTHHTISSNHHRYMDSFPIEENDLSYEYYYKMP